jgi:hypothetical protein
MNQFIKYININGLRNPKIIQFNENLILIGSKVYQEIENKKKYLLYSYLLTNDFEIIKNSEKLLDFKTVEEDFESNINNSCWIRDIYKENEYFYLLIEFKKNHNNEYFTSNNYYLKTKDFIKFEIHKKYDIQDFFFKDYNNHLFISKIINTEHIWGKYFFEFIINNKKIRPIFDNIVNYEKDYGHAFHNIEKKNNIYDIIFSIRHYDIKEKNNFYYKIYSAESTDLIHYTNTKELELNTKNIDTKWLCYPWKFKLNNNNYIICNQDDYGKEKESLIFKIL